MRYVFTAAQLSTLRHATFATANKGNRSLMKCRLVRTCSRPILWEVIKGLVFHGGGDIKWDPAEVSLGSATLFNIFANDVGNKREFAYKICGWLKLGGVESTFENRIRIQSGLENWRNDSKSIRQNSIKTIKYHTQGEIKCINTRCKITGSAAILKGTIRGLYGLHAEYESMWCYCEKANLILGCISMTAVWKTGGNYFPLLSAAEASYRVTTSSFGQHVLRKM